MVNIITVLVGIQAGIQHHIGDVIKVIFDVRGEV